MGAETDALNELVVRLEGCLPNGWIPHSLAKSARTACLRLVPSYGPKEKKVSLGLPCIGHLLDQHRDRAERGGRGCTVSSGSEHQTWGHEHGEGAGAPLHSLVAPGAQSYPWAVTS